MIENPAMRAYSVITTMTGSVAGHTEKKFFKNLVRVIKEIAMIWVT